MVTCGRTPCPIALFRGFEGVHEEAVALPTSMSGTRSKQASKSDEPAWDSLICSGLILFPRRSRRKRPYVLIILQLAYANAPICHVVPFGTCKLFAFVPACVDKLSGRTLNLLKSGGLIRTPRPILVTSVTTSGKRRLDLGMRSGQK